MSCIGVLKNGNNCGACSSCLNGNDGANGDTGASAYDVWIADGNVGTESDFLDSLVGADGAQGIPGSDGTTLPKANSYVEYIDTLNVADSVPDPAVYHFPPGYAVLTYTNSTGVARDYIVHASFDTTLSDSNTDDISNWVDGALIKTVSAVDSIEYEHLGGIDYRIGLFDGPLVGDVVNISTTNKVLSVDTNPVEVRVGTVALPKNVAFFKKVTLNDSETISLKFKTKDASAPSILNKAQIFILEID